MFRLCLSAKSGNVLRYCLYLLLAFCCTLSGPQKSWAQTGVVVTGTVTDIKGNALEGVSVTEKATNKSTMTDKNGMYKITIADRKNVLVFTSVNFEKQERSVGAKPIINVILKEEANALTDVVVVGYSTVKRKDLTGSVAKANMEDIQKAPVTSFDQALGGRIAGVVVSSNDGQPGSASQIVIRGSSVTQDASPLYIVDGFPIENLDINSININDIESIEVLKDASSIAIYGARGANGVIILTTRKGKAMPTRVSYNFSNGLQKDIRRMKMLSPYEFVKLQLELDSIQGTPGNPVTRFADRYLDPANGITLESYKNQKGLDWQDMLLRTGMLQTHNVSVIGGNADTKISLNASYTNQKGIIINTGMERYDGKFSLDHKIAKNLKLGVIASYTNSVTFGTIPTANAGGGVVFNMWNFRPVNVLGGQDLDGSLIDSTTLGDVGSTTLVPDNLVNPLQQAQNEYRKNITNTAIINSYLEYTFLKDFTLKISGGITSTTPRAETFYNSKTAQGLLTTNSQGTIMNVNGINGSVNNAVNLNYLNENTLIYRPKINKNHVLEVLAGFTQQYAKSSSDGFRATRIPESVEYLGMYSVNTSTTGSFTNSATHWKLFSLLGRVNYNLNEKYLFTVSVREDGSSKFAAGKQWGYFPSGAFGWRFSKEKFASGLRSFLSDGKLRISYGTVGNNRVGDFSYLSQFGSLQNNYAYAFNNVYVPGIQPFFYGNSNLRWETTKELDLGINLSLFKDRITIDADYYSKRTSDFLIGAPVPIFLGYGVGNSTQYQNTGVVRNRGFELSISTVNIKNRKFSWTSSFNISFNRSKILSFVNGVELIQTPSQFPGIATASNATAWIAKIGAPIAQYYGYQWAGVYQYSDFNQLANGNLVLKQGVPFYNPNSSTVNIQPGDPKYADINGDGIVDVFDQKVIGNPLPLHTGGFTNNFTYKNFSLGIFCQWSYGADKLNANKLVFESGSYYLNGNQFATYANRWTPTNPTNDIPRATYNTKTDPAGLTRVSSRLIEDGSFLRLKTVSFAYSLPAQVLKKIKLTNVKVFVAAQNLLTLTKYTGIDPEVSTFRPANPAAGLPGTSGTGYVTIQPSSSYVALAPGWDYTPYPRTLTVTFGTNITF